MAQRVGDSPVSSPGAVWLAGTALSGGSAAASLTENMGLGLQSNPLEGETKATRPPTARPARAAA